MLPNIFTSGLVLHTSVNNTLRLAALLCLLSACDNNGAPDNTAAAPAATNSAPAPAPAPAPAASSEATNAAPSPARVEGEVFRDALKDGGERRR